MVSDFDDGGKVGGDGGDLVPQNPAPQGNSPFDQFRRVRPDGTEYWSARDIQVPFGYGAWREFEKVVLSAAEDFMNLLGNADDHFARTHKMVSIGSGASRQVVDYELSRYACYVTAMRCNTEEGSFARAYFAARTRRDELRLPPTALQRNAETKQGFVSSCRVSFQTVGFCFVSMFRCKTAAPLTERDPALWRGRSISKK